GHENAALHRFHQLGHVAVAGVISAAGVCNADHRSLQGPVRIPRTLDERLAEEQRESAIPVVRQTLRNAVTPFLRIDVVPGTLVPSVRINHYSPPQLSIILLSTLRQRPTSPKQDCLLFL